MELLELGQTCVQCAERELVSFAQHLQGINKEYKNISEKLLPGTEKENNLYPWVVEGLLRRIPLHRVNFQ